MGRLPMLDLDAQHAPLRSELQAAAARVLASNRFILGEEASALEGELAAALGVPYAIGVSSGTDALLSLLMAAGVGAGDEVVTTPFSFFATAEAIVRLGARPVFADVDPETLNLDPALALARITPRTRAVVVVHLFGRAARTSLLASGCAASGIPLVEDAAQSIGAASTEAGARRPVGTSGFGAALSFFPSKNLGGFGDGGMVLTARENVSSRIRLLRNHGAAARLRHDVVGGNFRLDELQAALLRVKVPFLERWAEARRRIAMRYRERLVNLPVGLPPFDEGCVWNQFVIRVAADQRGALVEHLAAREIATAIYYPLPLHLQPALSRFGYQQGDFPVAERAAREALALPIYPSLDDRSVDRVGEAIGAFFDSTAGSTAQRF